MKIVKYNGPADRYLIDETHIWRDIPTRVNNQIAAKLAKRGERFTIEDEPSDEGTTEGEEDAS